MKFDIVHSMQISESCQFILHHRFIQTTCGGQWHLHPVRYDSNYCEIIQNRNTMEIFEMCK